MKNKIFIILSLFAIVLLTGCGKVTLDLDKVAEQLSSIKTKDIDISLVFGEVTMDEKYQNMEYIYENDYEKYGFKLDDLDSYSFGLNGENKDFYVMFKAKDKKSEDVKKSIKSFVEKLAKDEKDKDIKEKLNNYSLKEVEGYIVAVASTDNDGLLKLIKNAKNPVFANVMPVPVESIEDVLGIKPEQVDEFLMATPMMIVRSDTYIIVKPSEGNKKEVKEKIDEYMTNLEEQWKLYLPEQYELVQNRLEKELGDYLVYIISNDNNLAYKTIKDCKK